jgi:hypothetical protein
VLLYAELFACCVDFLILDGDALAALFPAAGVQALGLRLTAKQAMMLAAAAAVLPTVLLRDMSALSIVSVRPRPDAAADADAAAAAAAAAASAPGWAGPCLLAARCSCGALQVRSPAQRRLRCCDVLVS